MLLFRLGATFHSISSAVKGRVSAPIWLTFLPRQRGVGESENGRKMAHKPTRFSLPFPAHPKAQGLAGVARP